MVDVRCLVLCISWDNKVLLELPKGENSNLAGTKTLDRLVLPKDSSQPNAPANSKNVIELAITRKF